MSRVRIYKGDNIPQTFRYPFECDRTGEDLRAAAKDGFDGKQRLLHYLRFAEVKL